MPNIDPVEIAHAWIQAFNAKDLDGLLALYHLDAQHYSPKLKVLRPETNGVVKGISALREWYADAMNRLPHLHYQLIRLTSAQDRILMEYKRVNPGEPDLRVGEMLEIEDGLIIASRVYHS